MSGTDHKAAGIRRLGVHVSIAGGVFRSLERGHRLGCTTVQLFSHNPRSWTVKHIPGEESMEFRRVREELNISPVYVHTSYLINIASSSEELRAKSASLLIAEMERADELGADYVVLHTGSAHDGGGLKRANKSLKEVSRSGNHAAGLLLENTSGKKGDIASRIADMALVMESTGDLVSGICIDTCHAFSAGYELSVRDGSIVLVKEIEKYLGMDKVKLIHLNDSKGRHGTGTDRHEHIGLGEIGLETLGEFVTHRALCKVPIILETPKKTEKDDLMNLQKVRGILGRG